MITLIITCFLLAFVQSEHRLVQLFRQSRRVTYGPGHEVELFQTCARVESFAIKSNFEQETVALDGNFLVNTTKENEGFYVCNNGTFVVQLIHMIIEGEVKTPSKSSKFILYEMLINNTNIKDVTTYLRSLCTRNRTHEICEIWIPEEIYALLDFGTSESSNVICIISATILGVVVILCCFTNLYCFKKLRCYLKEKRALLPTSDDVDKDNDCIPKHDLKETEGI